MRRPRVHVVDPQTEADIEAYHRGREYAVADEQAQREPILSEDAPEIGRELEFDLFAAAMQGAI